MNGEVFWAIVTSLNRPVVTILLHVLLLCPLTTIAAGHLRADSTETGGTSIDSLAIRHVYLIGRQSSSSDVLVTILIVGGKLAIVTRDEIDFRNALILDGGEGYLMGQMVVSGKPSFVILDANPREQIDVILNSARHIRFALQEGVIIQNELPVYSPEESFPHRRKIRYTGYVPPPLAVPLSYYDSRKWNRFATRFISGLFTGAMALDRLEWLTQDTDSEAQVGVLETSSVGEVRALRFGLVGTLNFKRPWIYTVFVASNAFDRGLDATTDNKLILYDLRLDIPLFEGLNLSVGKQKEPISMERLFTLLFLNWQERAAPGDAFLPARNYGITINGAAFNQRVSWATGIFKNWVDSDFSFGETPLQWTSRITGLPIVSPKGTHLLHLGLALRYSDAKQPVVGKTEAEFFSSPVFVETQQIQADHTITYNGEIFGRSGPFTVGMQYYAVNIAADHLQNPLPTGLEASGSWILTGEMRPYRKRSGLFDPVPVSRPVNTGGWGALEASVRYTNIDLSEGLLDGGQMDTYSLGLNWWPISKIQFGVNYRYILLDRFDIIGKSSGVNFRLMLILD